MKLLHVLEKKCTSYHEAHLFNAAFCLVFSEFSRGKLASKSLKEHDSQPLRRNDIDIIKVFKQMQVKIAIRQSKTNQLGQSATLFLLERGHGLSCLLGYNFLWGTVQS